MKKLTTITELFEYKSTRFELARPAHTILSIKESGGIRKGGVEGMHTLTQCDALFNIKANDIVFDHPVSNVEVKYTTVQIAEDEPTPTLEMRLEMVEKALATPLDIDGIVDRVEERLVQRLIRQGVAKA